MIEGRTRRAGKAGELIGVPGYRFTSIVSHNREWMSAPEMVGSGNRIAYTDRDIVMLAAILDLAGDHADISGTPRTKILAKLLKAKWGTELIRVKAGPILVEYRPRWDVVDDPAEFGPAAEVG